MERFNFSPKTRQLDLTCVDFSVSCIVNFAKLFVSVWLIGTKLFILLTSPSLCSILEFQEIILSAFNEQNNTQRVISVMENDIKLPRHNWPLLYIIVRLMIYFFRATAEELWTQKIQNRNKGLNHSWVSLYSRLPLDINQLIESISWNLDCWD